MGLLDSNIIKTSGLVKSATLWTNQSAIVDARSLANAIDCKDYNTLQLTISTYTEAPQLSLIGFYSNNADNYYQSDVAVININDIRTPVVEKSKSFSPALGVTHTYVVDVSRFSKIGFGKLTTNGSVNLSYSLDQTSRGYDMSYEYYQKASDLLDPLLQDRPNIGQTFYISNKNTIRLLIKSTTDISFNSLFVKKELNGDSITINGSRIYNSSTGEYIRKTCNLKSGYNDLYVDVSDAYSFTINAACINNGTLSVFKSEIDSTIVLDNYKDQVKIPYLVNHTGARGNNDWVAIPTWARSCRIVCYNEGAVFTTAHIAVKKGNPTPSTAAPQGSTFVGKYCVDADTLVVNTANSLTHSVGASSYWLDCSNYQHLSAEIGSTASGVSIAYEFYADEIPDSVKKALSPDSTSGVLTAEVYDRDYLKGTDFVKFCETRDVDFYYNSHLVKSLYASFRNVFVWYGGGYIYLSTTGINGVQESIKFDSVNFPNLISGSDVEKIVVMPWSRNATSSYAGSEWRMNVITRAGQVYHNFPSRGIDTDGVAQANDYKLFDESVIWDLEDRFHPVKTTTGQDATLIATGKYKYMPCYPDHVYELYPAINNDNGYGNGGHPAVITKNKSFGGTYTCGRFWKIDRTNLQSNAMTYMGGFEAHPKLTVLGTYRSNTPGAVSRICTFFTNDGGRNWFNRYEFGATGALYSDTNVRLCAPKSYDCHTLAFTGTASSGEYIVKRRFQIIPDATTKEPSKKFTYGSALQVASIVGTSTSIKVTTAVAHTFDSGDVVVFEKVAGNPVFDWLVNTGHTETSAGDGVIFKVIPVDATSFTLLSCVHNPNNPLTVRHIHSVNRCKDGYMIGSGEMYPDGGWIVYLPVIPSDSFAKMMPWDNMSFIRINSTLKSIQRPLGVIIKQDADNTVYIGVDNESTDLGNVTMPEGRTETFKRSSNGVFKGKLIDVDDQSKFECVFESQEVCYFYKEIDGVMIYIGQQGHIGVSYDSGVTWTEARLPREMKGELSHFGGSSYNKELSIDNLLIKLKR